MVKFLNKLNNTLGIPTWLQVVVIIVNTFMLIGALTHLQAGEVEEVERISKLDRWAGSKVEVRQWDGIRVDLLTDEYAIEADWSVKYAECFGQAALYGIYTDRKPAMMLLVKDFKKEARYIYRARILAAKYGFKLFLEKVEE